MSEVMFSYADLSAPPLIRAVEAQVYVEVKVLTHSLLLWRPEARPCLLRVDLSGSPEAVGTSLASRAAARQLLDHGGCDDRVPSRRELDSRCHLPVIDAPWQPCTAHPSSGWAPPRADAVWWSEQPVVPGSAALGANHAKHPELA